MDLPAPLGWLVDEGGAAPGPERFLADLGGRLARDGLPLAGGALTLAVSHPIIDRRTWLWRRDTGAVIEALGFAGEAPRDVPATWLAELGPVLETAIGAVPGAALGWAGGRVFDASEEERLRQVARFATAPLAALSARETQAALLEAYLGRRSAARVARGALRRGSGETIRAVLLVADLRDFTALSEASAPSAVITALDAWFDRIAGAVHAFGGEVLKFIGDGVLAIFPIEGEARDACARALRAAEAVRAGMAHLNEERCAQGLAPLAFGAALHVGEILWGNVGAIGRLDFTAIGAAVNLASRLEGLCRPLGRTVLASGAFAAECGTSLDALGEHALRGVAATCAVYALPEPWRGSPDDDQS